MTFPGSLALIPVEVRQPIRPLGDIDAIGVVEAGSKFGVFLFEPAPQLLLSARKACPVFLASRSAIIFRNGTCLSVVRCKARIKANASAPSALASRRFKPSTQASRVAACSEFSPSRNLPDPRAAACGRAAAAAPTPSRLTPACTQGRQHFLGGDRFEQLYDAPLRGYWVSAFQRSRKMQAVRCRGKSFAVVKSAWSGRPNDGSSSSACCSAGSFSLRPRTTPADATANSSRD